MAFNNRYTNTLDRDGKGKHGERSCILPFFGFKYGSDTTSYTQGVYISDANELSGQRKVYGTHELEVEVYSRNNTPTGKALQLEEKFISLVGGSHKDPWKMPYMHTSLKEFYDDKIVPPAVAVIGCALGVVLVVLWFILYSVTFPPVESMFGYDMGCVVFVFVAPIVICLICAALGGIVDLIKKLTGKTVPKFQGASASEKQKARQQYFDHMVSTYGEQAGAVLKEYAILKCYDRF